MQELTQALPSYLTHNPAAGTPPYFEDDPAVVAVQQQFGEGIADYSHVAIGETLVRKR